MTYKDTCACLPTCITHTYIYQYVCTIYTDIHVCLSTYIHMYLRGNIHEITCACLATHIHTYMPAWIHNLHAYNIYVFMYSHTCIHTYTLIFLHVCLHI